MVWYIKANKCFLFRGLETKSKTDYPLAVFELCRHALHCTYKEFEKAFLHCKFLFCFSVFIFICVFIVMRRSSKCIVRCWRFHKGFLCIRVTPTLHQSHIGKHQPFIDVGFIESLFETSQLVKSENSQDRITIPKDEDALGLKNCMKCRCIEEWSYIYTGCYGWYIILTTK